MNLTLTSNYSSTSSSIDDKNPLELVFTPRVIQESSQVAPIALTLFSTVGTIALLYFLRDSKKDSKSFRSTILPGYGILGDKVNEVVELFLDTLAIYVHNDKQWDCSRRMLCEANQRASDYGGGYGILTYFLSLSVSFLLRGQRVSESMEAMRRGRHGMDCKSSYPHCPFSL